VCGGNAVELLDVSYTFGALRKSEIGGIDQKGLIIFECAMRENGQDNDRGLVS